MSLKGGDEKAEWVATDTVVVRVLLQMLHFFTKAWRSSTKNTDGERASYERENSVKASSRRVGEGITRKVQHKTPLKVMVINIMTV